MRYGFTIVAIILSAWLSSSARAADRDEALCKDSKENYRNGIAACTRLIKSGKGSASVFNSRGVMRDLTGDHDGAIADHNEAIRLDPTNHKNYLMRGCSYRDKGDYRKPVADVTAGIRLCEENCAGEKRKPMLAISYDVLYRIYELAGNHKEAIDSATAAIRLRREYIDALGSEKKKIYVDSLAETLEDRSKAYRALGDDRRAEADHREVLRLNPHVGSDR
jgi:tetratricopeptide (TPR) repeat protein